MLLQWWIQNIVSCCSTQDCSDLQCQRQQLIGDGLRRYHLRWNSDFVAIPRPIVVLNFSSDSLKGAMGAALIALASLVIRTKVNECAWILSIEMPSVGTLRLTTEGQFSVGATCSSGKQANQHNNNTDLRRMKRMLLLLPQSSTAAIHACYRVDQGACRKVLPVIVHRFTRQILLWQTHLLVH